MSDPIEPIAPTDADATVTAPPPPPAIPVTGAERIETLDVLRGFSVLGILVMNISVFAQIGAAYMNPLAAGPLSRLDWIIWSAAHLLADNKFMTLFSLLFGAGVILFASRVEARGRKPAGLHYRRMFWLWLIGMFHAYALWWGDILVAYATCGAIVYLFRKLRPRTLLIIAGVMLVLPSLTFTGVGLIVDKIPAEHLAEMEKSWLPPEETIADEVASYRGGWLDQMSHRAMHSAKMQTGTFIFFAGPRIFSLMLAGMALFKLGVITGAARRQTYVLMMAVGWSVGFIFVAAGMVYNHHHEFVWNRSMLLGMQFNYWGSLFVAAAYMGMIALWVRGGGCAGLRARLGAVGRMAFSNYLGHTLIFTLVFYGHGLGLFASVPRWQQMLMVAAAFGFQLWFSTWWLARFRFGPMEWLWRSLTYWKWQPMKRAT